MAKVMAMDYPTGDSPESMLKAYLVMYIYERQASDFLGSHSIKTTSPSSERLQYIRARDLKDALQAQLKEICLQLSRVSRRSGDLLGAALGDYFHDLYHLRGSQRSQQELISRYHNLGSKRSIDYEIDQAGQLVKVINRLIPVLARQNDELLRKFGEMLAAEERAYCAQGERFRANSGDCKRFNDVLRHTKEDVSVKREAFVKHTLNNLTPEEVVARDQWLKQFDDRAQHVIEAYFV